MKTFKPNFNSMPHGGADEHRPFHICPECHADLASGTDCTGLPALCTACKALASIRQAHINYAEQFPTPITHREIATFCLVVYLAHAANWIERRLQAVRG